MRYFLISGIFLILQLSAFSQSMVELQKKKQEAMREIEFTTRLLKKTSKDEKSSLNKLRLINKQISRRNGIISNINDEIKLLGELVANNTLAVEMLKNDVEKLKQEYAKMIQMAYKNKDLRDERLFLFSAESFNQAYRRLLYFRRYSEYRHEQAQVIGEVQVVLNENIDRLEKQQQAKQELIDEEVVEKQRLADVQGQQYSELQKLKKARRKLQQKLNKQRKVEQQLEREIQRIIEEEARKKRAAGGSAFALTPEQKLIGDNFAQNKKRLPWPVERGVIIEKFGVHKHPVLNNVQVRNNGVNIATENDAKVRSVFKGEVSRVFGISGGNTAVIIRHGNYLSVYSNLREVSVKKGDKVSTKQVIGTVFTDKEENKSILKFQVWHESNKLNPEDWIGK